MLWKRFAVLVACLAIAAIPVSPQQSANVAIREGSSDSTKIAVIEERLRGMQIALDLQAAKYEDRLLQLNHAHDKQVADQATYLAKDAFEATLKGWEEWRTQIEKRLTIIEAKAAGNVETRGTLLSLILAAVSIIGLVFMLWTRKHGPH